MALEPGFSAGDLGWAKVYLVELAALADPGLVDGAAVLTGPTAIAGPPPGVTRLVSDLH